jgi:hypothetical protein
MIHSPNFAFTEFSEVRAASVRPYEHARFGSAALGYYPDLLIILSAYGLRYDAPHPTGPGLCAMFSLP